MHVHFFFMHPTQGIYEYMIDSSLLRRARDRLLRKYTMRSYSPRGFVWQIEITTHGIVGSRTICSPILSARCVTSPAACADENTGRSAAEGVGLLCHNFGRSICQYMFESLKSTG